MTNYEKVKEMSVEEMAMLLLRVESNTIPVPFHNHDCGAFLANDCEERCCALCYEDYLRSEARGVNNGK